MAGVNAWSRLTGLPTLLGLILRGALQARPEPRNLSQRLAMLPLRGAPLAADVQIRWNAQQVPMIEASSDEDLMVALGLVHAHLRLGQIEVLRRVSQARVAEMIGPLGLELDQSLQALQLGRAVPAMLAAMPAAQRRLAESFVAGLNHGLLATSERPPEFALLGLEAQPWSLAEWLQFGRLAAVDISWLVWQRLLPLRRKLDPKLWQALWPRLCSSGMGSGVLTSAPPATQALSGLLRSGSNAVAVAAARSTSGGALLASDPHLPLQLPGAWLLAGWRSPGFHCVGLMMPGLPFMLLGRNPWLAWGGTSLHAQSSDLYDVSSLPADAFRWHQREVQVRGGRARVLRWRECELGPVVSDGLLWRSPTPLALRWVGHQPSDELGAMLAVARARSRSEFRQALEGYAVSGANLVCCDQTGGLAHVLAARIPARCRPDPPDLCRQPDEQADWQTLLGSGQLPARCDPADGILVSANQAPPQGGPPVGYFFAPPDRALRWEQLLGAGGALDAEALKQMQRDVFSARSLALCRQWLQLLPVASWPSSLQPLRQALQLWDGRYTADSSGALAFELLQTRLGRQLRRRPWRQAYHAVWLQQSLLAEDLAALPPEQLRQQLRRALPWVARRWRRYRCWGRVHRLQLSHPLAALAPWRALRTEALPAAGGNATVCKSGHGEVQGPHRASFGSCARQVCDLADPDANDFVLLGGQDGWPGSDTGLDQLALWQQGAYIRMPLRRASVEAAYPHLTRLQAGP